MSLIEQAAKRLEELRRAGVEIPEVPGDPSAGAAQSPGTVFPSHAWHDLVYQSQCRPFQYAAGCAPRIWCRSLKPK